MPKYITSNNSMDWHPMSGKSLRYRLVFLWQHTIIICYFFKPNSTKRIRPFYNLWNAQRPTYSVKPQSFENFYPTGFWLSFEKASAEARVTERSRDLKIDTRLHTIMRIFKNRFRDDALLFRNMTWHTVCQNVLCGPLGIDLTSKTTFNNDQPNFSKFHQISPKFTKKLKKLQQFH